MRAHLIKLHEAFAQAVHFIAVDYCGLSVPSGGISMSVTLNRCDREHTVGGGHNIIKQLGGTDRTSSALHIVHGSRVGLGGLVH